METSDSPQAGSLLRFKIILSAWLLAGTLDITAAIIQTLLAGGSITRLMQYIASGVFGTAAFDGGMPYAVMGLGFHYLIAFGWSFLFLLIYPKLTFAPRHRLLTGIAYGVVVWFMMNRVVLPLSNVPQRPFDPVRSLIAAAVLMVAIGIPLSFLASRHYAGKSR